jgi:hypothetical protein
MVEYRPVSDAIQIQRSGFHSRRYQIFWEVVGPERNPLSLVSTIEELLGRKSIGSGQENRNYGSALTIWHPNKKAPWPEPARELYQPPLVGEVSANFPSDTLYPQKLALTSPLVGHWIIVIMAIIIIITAIIIIIIKLTNKTDKQTNSMVWVCERTIPTEWPPTVGEVIANFCG